ADVGEFRTVEIVAERGLWTVRRPFQPDELRLRVDEAADQPGRCDAIDPRPPPCRPSAAAVVRASALRDASACGVRLVRCELRVERGFQIGERVFDLLARRTGEEVDRR